MHSSKTILRRRLLLGLAGVGGTAAAFVWERHTRPRIHQWREALSHPRAIVAKFPEGFGTKRIFIDPGHGANNNSGNVSCLCQDEQDFALQVSHLLADSLRQTGHFEVKLSRDADERVAYADRVQAAASWNADVFLSIHSDIRGQTGDTWMAPSGKVCRVNLSAPGFSVLFSEDGQSTLVDARRRLGRSTAARMIEAGFAPYLGTEYGALYANDPGQVGVFMDRHAYEQRIYVLWKPSMPSVIVETHHALDPREARLWAETSTLQAFASAIGAALVDTLVNTSESP